MYAILLMLSTTACYTITSLSDKYAISKAKYERNEFTFLMCSSMSVFLLISLMFQNIYFSFSWQSYLSIALVTLFKLLEFQMSSLVLKELSAFELKAWLGIILFVSYIADVWAGTDLRITKLIFIGVTIIGLIFIAKSKDARKINYRAILIPLILYLISKFGYGYVIKSFSSYAAPTLQLLIAMMVIALIMLPFVSMRKLFKEKCTSTTKIVLARIPNTVGMILENAVIAISLVNYSFIQPMILCTLFVIGLFQKEKHSQFNIIGSILCVIGVACFQIF